jgi:glycine cleavage system transcriptional repressor
MSAMTRYYAVTALGADQRGIVAEVSKVLCDVGASVLDSSNSIVGGQFAMTLLMSAPGHVFRASVASVLRTVIAKFNLLADVKEVSAEQALTIKTGGPVFQILLQGTYRADLMHRVAGFLRQQGLNVLELRSVTGAEGKPHTYRMDIKAQATDAMTSSQLSSSMSLLGEELGVQLQVI